MADEELKKGIQEDLDNEDLTEGQQDSSDSASPSGEQLTEENDSGADQDAESQTDGEDPGQEEVPPAASSLEDTEDSISDGEAGGGTEPDEGGLDDLASEDLGLSITDDELWDESGGLDEIPLFDELEKKDQEEEKALSAESQDHEKVSAEGPVAQEEESAPKEPSDEKGAVEDVASAEIEEEGPGDTSENPFFIYIPYIISGVNVILFIVGLVVLVNLLTASQVSTVKSLQKTDTKFNTTSNTQLQAQVNTLPKESEVKEVQDSRTGFYTMTLDPFIIPAQLNGELVFFKLKAELVFDDVASKRAFSQRESALRDIIYSELKGIDITAGLSNKNLFSYRRPIMKRLNEYFAPHRVTDIRLVGFVLK